MFGAGLSLLIVGITVMTGWLARSAVLVRFGNEHSGVMVFNTALCFAAIGFAFVLQAFHREAFRRVCIAIGWAIIALVALVMSQFVLPLDLPIDWWKMHLWLDTAQPGRIAPSTGLGLALAGAVLVVLAGTPGRRKAIFVHVAILAVFATGLLALLNKSLHLYLIYPSLQLPHIANLSAVMMVVTSAGLWAIWYRTSRHVARFRLREDDKVSYIGATILIVIGLTVGIGTLTAQMAAIELSLGDKLTPILDDRSALFEATIEHALDRADLGAQRLGASRYAGAIDAAQIDAESLKGLRERAQNLLGAGFSGIAILDTHEREVLREGMLAENPPLEVALNLKSPAALLWQDGYFLNSRVRIMYRGKWFGTLVSEQRLSGFEERLFDVRHLGNTGEVGICLGRGQAALACFPETVAEHAIRHAVVLSAQGNTTAMSLAVAGQHGLRVGNDYKGNSVIAAYGPLAPGLGIVVKQDTAELLAPVRQQIQWALPILLAVVAAGAFLLRSLVKPIASRMLRSEREAIEKEHRLRALIANVAEGIVTLDAYGVIESFNSAAAEIFGYAPDEVIGHSIHVLMPADAGIYPYSLAATRATTTEYDARRRDGSALQIEFSTSVLQLDGRRAVTLIVRDITSRKQTEAALFAEKERLHVTLGSIGDAVIATDTQARVTYMNPVAQRMTGWSDSQASGRPLSEVFHIINGASGDRAPSPAQRVIAHQQPAGSADNTVLVSRSGERYAIKESAAPIRDRAGHVVGVVLVFHDDGKAREMASLMSYHATHDYLTDLINRREFERHLHQRLQHRPGVLSAHSLLYVDLDRFKIVNDSCGHEAGDQLLRQLAAVLQTRLADRGLLARLGGDEFGILIDNATQGAAQRIAEDVLAAVDEFRFVWHGKTFTLGASIGLVSFLDGGSTPQEVLRMGDAACYLAKDKGRGRIQVHVPTETVLAERVGEVDWLDRIRRSLDENAFVLYAQKIMPLDAAQPGEHFELLIRMIDGNGMIAPMAFLPVAERYGLMPRLDRWVIQAAFARYEQLAALGRTPGTFAINLSGATVGDEHFVRFMLEQFERYEVPPHKICFEITETSAIANLGRAATLIETLRATGCKFSLDDFGTGMSSFAYLKHLPVDYLKIDGGFVKDMMSNRIDFAMVESINHIGHLMGIETIAEFAEDDAIIEALRGMGVDYAQGYGVARPVPLDALVTQAAQSTQRGALALPG